MRIRLIRAPCTIGQRRRCPETERLMSRRHPTTAAPTAPSTTAYSGSHLRGAWPVPAWRERCASMRRRCSRSAGDNSFELLPNSAGRDADLSAPSQSSTRRLSRSARYRSKQSVTEDSPLPVPIPSSTIRMPVSHDRRGHTLDLRRALSRASKGMRPPWLRSPQPPQLRAAGG